MPKTTSRQKILNYLRRHNAVTSADLGKALRVTPANIRHHLSRLVSDGLVEVSGFRMDGQRGRPQKVYRLSRLALGDNLPALIDGLLAEFLGGLDDVEKAAVLRRIAARIFPEASSTAGLPILRRLTATVESLNRMHYQPHWEAHAAGPRLIFGQCPYASVIERNPSLCLLDKAVLELHLAVSLEQLAKLEHNERGLPVCIFALR